MKKLIPLNDSNESFLKKRDKLGMLDISSQATRAKTKIIIKRQERNEMQM